MTRDYLVNYVLEHGVMPVNETLYTPEHPDDLLICGVPAPECPNTAAPCDRRPWYTRYLGIPAPKGPRPVTWCDQQAKNRRVSRWRARKGYQ